MAATHDILAMEIAERITAEQVASEYFLRLADQVYVIEATNGYDPALAVTQRMYVLAHFFAAVREEEEENHRRRSGYQSELDKECPGAVEVVGAHAPVRPPEWYRIAAVATSAYMLRKSQEYTEEKRRQCQVRVGLELKKEKEGQPVDSGSAPAAQHSRPTLARVSHPEGPVEPLILPELPKDQQPPPRPVRAQLSTRAQRWIDADEEDADMDTRHEQALAPWTDAKKSSEGRKSAAALQEKAAELDGELKTINDAYYAKFAEWQATVVKARRQKKAEKRAAYEERNRRDRLRQAGHVVPPEPLNPAQLAAERTPEQDDEPVPVKVEVKEEVPKRVPPGGQIASKEKRVKR